MKNKKGFTLIELLVVIVLMISILIISIISLVSISNRKKEEALESIINQIEVASENYFENNRYLYDKNNMAKIISEDKEKIDSLNSKIIEYRGMVNAMTGNHDDLVEKIKSMTTEILKCKREIDKKDEVIRELNEELKEICD